MSLSRLLQRKRRIQPVAVFMYLGTYSPTTVVIVSMVSFAMSVLAQQSIRTPQPPQYQNFTPNVVGPSFLRLGPFSGTAGLGMGFTFNDNANTSESDKISLNQLTQTMNLDLVWVLSPFNRIDLMLGGELDENFYSNGQNAVTLTILPGSQINLQAKVGDVVLRAFEQFAIVQDPVTDPVVSGQSNLNRLTNTLGAGVAFPFYPFDLGLQFDYTYSDTLGSTNVPGTTSTGQSGTVRNSLALVATLGFPLTSFINSGLEVNGSTNYGAGSNDIDALSMGPFLRGRLTRLIEVDCGIGPLLQGAQSLSQLGYYAYLSLRYQITTISELVVGISHDTNFSAGLNVSENNNFHLNFRTNPGRRWSVTIGPFLNFGTASGTASGTAVNGQILGGYTQYGVSVVSSFQLSRKLSAIVGYRFVKRDAEQADSSYTQNEIDFSLAYHF